MKKPLIIFLAISSILIALFILLIIISFTTVRPTTDLINKSIAQGLSKLVRIPVGIPSPALSFDETVYLWEMETLDKEVTGVRLVHETGLSDFQDKINVVLELQENGDPSIFNKVLPAIIADPQSLNSALDPQKANLSANESVGYTGIELAIRESTGQTISIKWDFRKENLSPELPGLYSKLNIYPQPALRFLYELPNIILGLLSG